MTKSRGIMPPRVFWTEQEKQLVREMYPNTKNSEIVRILGRHTEKSVWRIAHVLGVKKSPEYLRLMGGYLDGKRGIASRFKPGNEPWSKGKKGIQLSPATQFKKGQRPVNWMPLGSLRVNAQGILERKIKEGPNGALNWEAEHRLVWKAANGPIPRNHCIGFKPGRFSNKPELITLDALMLLSRKEVMLENSIWRKSPELAALYQLKGQITRQVKRIKKEADDAYATH